MIAFDQIKRAKTDQITEIAPYVRTYFRVTMLIDMSAMLHPFSHDHQERVSITQPET